MENPIIDDLAWRYTTKKYDPSKKIPQEELDILFEAMHLSASSINSQPWKFIVIGSEEAKQRMHDTFAEKYQFNQAHIFESSQVILFAHNPHYTREDYAKVVDKGIEDKRTAAKNRESAFGSFFFAELNTAPDGDSSCWTKTQTYIALGNTLHILARLRIDSTPLEGIDTERVNREFAKELNGYRCEVALAIGYRHAEDPNAKLPKSRLSTESLFTHI